MRSAGLLAAGACPTGGGVTRLRPTLPAALAAAALLLLFVACALLRPIDHDESQYVAAAVLTANGFLPYRDYAYLQTPLQPFALAPVAWAAGAWTWPALRLVNALLGAGAVLLVLRAARAGGATRNGALAAAALFASCDILLFSAGTARNDALPAALLAGGIALAMRDAPGRGRAAATGLLFAAAAAAKISYALPAAAYGVWTLFHPARRPGWVALGALPPALLVAACWWGSPAGFAFGVFGFPARAPAEYYAARPWKLSLAAKLVDAAKFLALGPALLALVATVRAWRNGVRHPLLALLTAAGLVAALLPFPTWRQYLLPALPPLFVALALIWRAAPPGPVMRVAAAVFAAAGLLPSALALAGAVTAVPMARAMHDSAAIAAVLDAHHVPGPVATLSPQFLPATGRLPAADFATGPFYFRSRHLLPEYAERRLHLVSQDRPLVRAPVLLGGEGAWTSGDARLDRALADAVTGRGVAVPGTRFTLILPPAGGDQAAARAPASISR